VSCPPNHFVGYLTVYNTVLLVLPFSRPTVTVTRFRPALERDCPRDALCHIRRRKRRALMASAVVPLVIVAFLSGVVTAVFAMLVVGVHAGDRPRRLTAAPPRGRL
jgi:hypothetical protein